jgi:hypothetical protein
MFSQCAGLLLKERASSPITLQIGLKVFLRIVFLRRMKMPAVSFSLKQDVNWWTGYRNLGVPVTWEWLIDRPKFCCLEHFFPVFEVLSALLARDSIGPNYSPRFARVPPTWQV